MPRSAVPVTAGRRGPVARSPSATTAPACSPRRSNECAPAASGSTPAFPAHGLGLAIAAEIAEAAGGALELANAAPGLEATLLLPAA